jgi:hypothetical protein
MRLPWTREPDFSPLVGDKRLRAAVRELRSAAAEQGASVLSLSMIYGTDDGKERSGTYAGEIDGVGVWVSNPYD